MLQTLFKEQNIHESGSNYKWTQPSSFFSEGLSLLTKESTMNMLTLTEKLKLIHPIVPSINDKHHNDVDAFITQSPFNDSHLLQKWYQHYSLDQTKLALLHNNRWLKQSELYKRPRQETGYISSQKNCSLLSKAELGELIFIKPEISTALSVAADRLKAIKKTSTQNVFDINAMLSAFLPHLIKRLSILCKSTTDYVNKKCVLNLSEQEDCRGRLFNQFPALLRQVNQMISHWLQYITEFSQNISTDFDELTTIFFNGKQLGTLQSIIGELGDSHNQGRFAFICQFSCGQKLAYKPRNLKLDKQFYSFLDFLTKESNMSQFYLPKFLIRDNYGWMEYIETLPCQHKKEVSDYYHRSGCLLSILYLLEAEDIHLENIIARQDCPVIVDLETLFHLRDDSIISNEANSVEHTVLKTHFVPQYEFATPEQEIAAIISVPEKQSSPKRTSLPTLTGQSIPANDHLETFIKGFELGYQELIKLQPEIRIQLERFMGLQARYVARPTRIYNRLSQFSYQPYYLQSGLKLELYYEKLWLDVKRRPHLIKIINAEKIALLHGDVPLFTNLIGSKNLSFDRELQCKDYFRQDSFSLVLAKLDSLSQQDCSAQIKIIKRSLKLGRIDKPSVIKQKLPVSDYSSDAHWVKHSQIIANAIIEQAAINESGVFWNVYKPDHNGQYCLDSTNYKLYDGVLGIVLYLAYLNEISPDTSRLLFLKQECKRVLTSLLNHHFEEDGCGAFEGLGGIIYVISHLDRLWNESWLRTYAKQFISKIAKLVNSDKKYDIMTGSAGAILALLSYYQTTKDQYSLIVASSFGDHLVSNFIETPNGSGWGNEQNKIFTGFAHGIAGIAYSLMNLYQFNSKSVYKIVALKSIIYEQSTYCSEVGNWLDRRFSELEEQKKQAMSAWCNGAMGIGYSRLLMRDLENFKHDDSFNQDIDKAKLNTMTKMEIKNHCLCHGHFGNQEFIHQLIISEQSNKGCREDFIININQYINQLNESGFSRDSKHFESVGLMTGLSGVGYQLLKFTLPERLPSLLMLQPPTK